MPEIIEVDFLRQEINSQLAGRIILDAFLNKEKASNVKSSEFSSILKGKTLIGARRKGKILILDFSSNVSLIFHFLLTGFMTLVCQCEREKFQAGLIFKRDCLVIGGLMGAACARVVLSKDVFRDEILRDLGIDALSPKFTYNAFKSIILTNQKKNIKQVLMDQRLIAGIGNAYSDEIFFEAQLNPLRKCVTLTEKNLKRLYESIFSVFEESRKHGGESELSFVHLNGEKGKMQEHFKVHKRAGEKCIRCGNIVTVSKINSRTSYYCPVCQE